MKKHLPVLLTLGVFFGGCQNKPSEMAQAPVPTQNAPQAPSLGSVAKDSVIKLDYTLTVEGKVADTSQGKAPLSAALGTGFLISGLEEKLIGMKLGEEKEVDISPERGYGKVNPAMVQKVPRKALGADPKMQLAKGMRVQVQTQSGQVFNALIAETDKENVTLDLNHPLAGKKLHFRVKIVDIQPPQKTEEKPLGGG